MSKPHRDDDAYRLHAAWRTHIDTKSESIEYLNKADFSAAADEFSKPYRDRIAELEAENAQLRSVFVSPGSTLVLVAPKVASQDEMRDAANRASEAHDGPVILLAHDWQSMPIEELRAKIANVDRVPSSLICTCPATSEYDDPCPCHGVLSIGAIGRD
jgi:hypothetical protein